MSQQDTTSLDPADVELVLRRWQGQDLDGEETSRYFGFQKTDFCQAFYAATASPWGMRTAREAVEQFFGHQHALFGRKAQLKAGAELITGEPAIYWLAQIAHTHSKLKVSQASNSLHTDHVHELESMALHDATTHKLVAPLDPAHLDGLIGHNFAVVWGEPIPGQTVVVTVPENRSTACTTVLARD